MFMTCKSRKIFIMLNSSTSDCILFIVVVFVICWKAENYELSCCSNKIKLVNAVMWVTRRHCNPNTILWHCSWVVRLQYLLYFFFCSQLCSWRTTLFPCLLASRKCFKFLERKIISISSRIKFMCDVMKDAHWVVFKYVY